MLQIEIEPSYPGALDAIIDGGTVATDGGALQFHERRQLGFGFGEAVVFLLDRASDPAANIALSLLASWLYDTLKDRARKLRIGGRAVAMQPAAIEAALERELGKD